MTDSAGNPGFSPRERMLLALDAGVPGALYRILLGAAIAPLAQWLPVGLGPRWSLALAFIGVLAGLRVGSTVLRRLVRHSAALGEAWSVRRRTAKYYDSFQWRKLLWVGLGLALQAALAARPAPLQWALAACCLVAGAAGTLRWRSVAADPRHPKPAPRPARRKA